MITVSRECIWECQLVRVFLGVIICSKISSRDECKTVNVVKKLRNCNILKSELYIW